MSKSKKKRPAKRSKPRRKNGVPAGAAPCADPTFQAFVGFEDSADFHTESISILPPEPSERPDNRDLLYYKSARFGRRFWALRPSLEGLKTPEMIPLGRAFDRNARRVIAMAISPAALVSAAMFYQVSWCKAVHIVLQKPVMTPDDNEHRPKVVEHVNRLLDERPSDWDATLLREAQKHNVDFFAKIKDYPVHSGMVAMLSSQVIGAWSIFETLAKDVWIRAVNSRPKLLGSKPEVVGEKAIAVRLLQKYSFDLRNNMGDLLHDRFSFDAIDGARDAYVSAFGKSAPFVQILDAPSLNVIDQLRNVFIHRGGVADEKFVSRMKNNRRWSCVQEGMEIELDGKIVSALTWVAIKSAARLLIEVDDWLSRHLE